MTDLDVRNRILAKKAEFKVLSQVLNIHIDFFLYSSLESFFFCLSFSNAAERSTCSTHKLHSGVWEPIWEFYKKQSETHLLGKWLGSWATSPIASGLNRATVQISSLL